MALKYDLVCGTCQTSYEEPVFSCPRCDGALDIRYAEDDFKGLEPGDLPDHPGMWRYSPFLPTSFRPDFFLGEGGTPLLRSVRLGAKWGIPNLYFKCEHLNPSGSFKDRQIALLIHHAGRTPGRDEKAKFVISSSGNAGASLATYAARAGMDAVILVPADVRRAKLTQILSHGPEVITINRASADAEKYLSRAKTVRRLAAEKGWIPAVTARFVNPLAVEGAKTIAYEVSEGLHWRAPDYVFAPVGGGGLVGSVFKGFSELLRLGWTERIPQMVGAQLSGCSTVAKALLNGSSAIEPVIPQTEVSGVSAPWPLDGDWALSSIRTSRGAGCEVEDAEVEEAVRLLAREEGLFVEPAGALSVAALRRWAADGRLAPSDTVVCCLTGSGFKDLTSSTDRFVGAALKEVDIDALDAAF